MQKCRLECSLGVDLVVGNFLSVAFDTLTLYQILKQSDGYLWKYCILQNCRLATNAVLSYSALRVANYLRGYLPRYEI